MPISREVVASTVRRARVFKNGRNQAIRIPKDFELPEGEVILTKEGSRLIIEPSPAGNGLLNLLAGWEPLKVSFPDVDEGLKDLDDVVL